MTVDPTIPEFQTIHETETIARQAVLAAGDAIVPVREAASRARARLTERAVLLNAEGWQSMKIEDPLLSENPHDFTVSVTLKLKLWRHVDPD